MQVVMLSIAPRPHRLERSRRDPIQSCMAGVIKAIEFLKPKGGGDVVVRYPLTVDPGAKPAAPATTPSKPVPAPVPNN